MSLNEWLQWICLAIIAGILGIQQIIGWLDDKEREQ